MRLHLAIVFVLVAAAAREPDAAPEATVPSGDDLLGAIDFAPARTDLDAAMSAAENQLIAIATDDSEPNDGRRLRAIRALAQYPSDGSRAALLSILGSLADALAGVDVLFLRAAIEAYAITAGSEAVPVIVQFLDSQGEDLIEGQDIRATAAKALGDIRSQAAVNPLLDRYSVEQSQQVRFAITEALRAILGS